MNKNIKYVATLQTYAEPYVILYCDISNHQLWLQVHIDEGDAQLWIPANAESIMEYMDNAISLHQLYNISRGSASSGIIVNPNVFDEIDEFDSDLCDNEVKARYFLRNSEKVLNNI